LAAAWKSLGCPGGMAEVMRELLCKGVDMEWSCSGFVRDRD